MLDKIRNFTENLFDVKVIANWRLEHYAHAQAMQILFDHFDITTVFDVGANEGQFVEFLRCEVGFDGLILSFEPAPRTFEILQERASKDPDWHCFNQALGAEVKVEKFNIMSGSQYSSILKPDIEKIYKDGNKIIDCFDVEVTTLDHLWAQLYERYDLSSAYLKMDTQGYDLQVLKGGSQIIEHFKALQSELSVIPLYHAMPDYVDVIRYLEKENFALSSMHPVLVDEERHLIEFDGIFVNALH